MKSFKISFLVVFCMAVSVAGLSQSVKTEIVPVSGNCGMCKSKIEKAALNAGATKAEWDKDSKKLSISYNSATTNTGKVMESVAAAGYDNRDVKATDEAYNKLHSCCKYERTEVITPATKKACCDMKDCKHDGKECTMKEADKASACCAKTADGATAANNAKVTCCSDSGVGQTKTEAGTKTNCCSAAH